jgi:hypothetical protein
VPFRNTPDGPYAILLRDIEERQRDLTLLRTAIEPLRKGPSATEFVAGLITEYDDSAVAFVRYFLTADMLMLLELAPNMTAALSERISALETCVAQFGFGFLMSEDELRLEQQALTASLMLLRVNNNQFDVPWATFKRDAGDRGRDAYAIHVAMRKASSTLAVLAEITHPYSHRFPNGRTVEYLLSSRTSTMSGFVLGVIDAFYDHPSYGIESILSTRFRHDTLRRQFSSALESLAGSRISGVAPPDQAYIVEALGSVSLGNIDAWLQRRMQSLRPGQADGLFDFTPQPVELKDLVREADRALSLEGALDVVIEWIISRLDEAIGCALESFRVEFRDAILSSHMTC